jgi:hypothetical protein
VTRVVALLLVGWSLAPGRALAQSTAFAGIVGGISTLSADGRSTITSSAIGVSLYKPENGPALNLLAGWHLGDFLTFQGNYIWNRNRLTLTSSVVREADVSFYEQGSRSAQQSVVGDLLLYFRNRQSGIRPYLSVGGGVVRFTTRSGGIVATRGAPPLPRASVVSTRPALRVAVGIDLAIGHGWSFRYSFSESIRQNAISAQLTPPGRRNLANFQNLFGVVKDLQRD